MLPGATTSQETPAVAAPRPPRPATGILRLAGRLLCLGLPFALFLLWFEFRYHENNPSHMAAKRSLLERCAADTEIVVLGNSHEATGIYPMELSRPAFNLASQCQSLYYDIEMLRHWRARLPNLKMVVFGISCFSLEYELEDVPDRWRAFHYRYFNDIPHPDWRGELSVRNVSAYFLSSESYRARVAFGAVGNAMGEYDARGGWTNRPCQEPIPRLSSQDMRSVAAATARLHETMMRSNNLPANVERLRRAVETLSAEGVRVVFVSLPVSPEYRAQLDLARYGRMRNTVSSLAAELRIPYRNYMFSSGFSNEDFTDADHLNCPGARKFTALLDEDVIQPVLASNRMAAARANLPGPAYLKTTSAEASGR
jgi:hypothetical protein